MQKFAIENGRFSLIFSRSLLKCPTTNTDQTRRCTMSNFVKTKHKVAIPGITTRESNDINVQFLWTQGISCDYTKINWP
jgi:hypothetical protein